VTEIRLNQLLEMVPGVLADEEALLLFRSASETRGGCVLKIGARFNRPAVALVVGVAAHPELSRPRFYCVEPRGPEGSAQCVVHGAQAHRALKQTTEKLGCGPLAERDSRIHGSQPECLS
jgi:hypothetical protein